MQFRHPRAVVLLFIGIIVVMQAAFWLLPRRSFSENEKRVLSEVPQIDAAGIADGVTQPQTDRDALAFAGSVLFMAESGSLQGLASLAAFPLTVHLDGINETIVAPEELEELGPSRIFTPARTDAILSANLYALREENGRWILGKTDGPNIVFRREGAGTGFYVAEIN